MKWKDYLRDSARTCASLGDKVADNLHMVLGMVTEVAELADALKKALAYGKQVDWVNVEEEIGDLMWYVANFCRINGLDFEDILERNINKLRVRYPEKFTHQAANNRNLSAERKVLEGHGQN